MKLFFTLLLVLLFFATLSFCIYKIIKSIQSECKLKNVFLNPSFDIKIEDEPFCGAAYLASLLVYVTKNSMQAEKILNLVFKTVYRVNWSIFCLSAERIKSSLNGDLLCECLAAKLLKENSDVNLIEKIFEALKKSEIFWDKSERGSLPSSYLSELLNYKIEDECLVKAYKTLGLEKNASFEEVKSAHRKLIAKFHPDTKKTSWSKKEKEAFISIQEAYELIAKSEH